MQVIQGYLWIPRFDFMQVEQEVCEATVRCPLRRTQRKATKTVLQWYLTESYWEGYYGFHKVLVLT